MNPPTQSSLQELMAVRRHKLETLREAGVDGFGGRFPVDGTVGEVAAGFVEGKAVRLAGRVTAHRNMGKSQFLDLTDFTGRLQVYLHGKELGEEGFRLFKQVDIGDFLGVEGTCFLTKTGEPSVHATSFEVLAKSLRPLPDKWHGIADAEIKYRQRYLDLIANPASRDVFQKRIRILREIRSYLEARGFLEVETPMMQAVPGGAAAAPFRTHHNALGMDLFLRIAPELYLKRLLVAGLPKVFELNRNFRNEGISRRHNPEFTMLEAYWAYADFSAMAELVEDLICTVAEKVCGGLLLEHRDEAGEVVKTINLQRPWKRAKYEDLIREVQPDWYDLTEDGRRQRALDLGLDISHCVADFEVTQHLFEKHVEEKQLDPLFVTHCPQQLVPLAKLSPGRADTVEVYELVINGQEISPGYSELNDPLVQRRRLEEQSGGETQKLDEEFLLALEYGMPPAGGLGLGIDRLVMMLTGAESIRDVILFPHLRQKPQA
jgi:lysyl-tRNA synthetase class 2